MKIVIASDHAGFELKNVLKNFLHSEGYEVVDYGPKELNEGDDYPDYIFPCAKAVQLERGTMGVIIGGSGQGEAILANRLPNIRAAVVYSDNEEIVRLSREHNDANIISLGARFITKEQAKRLVRLWLATPFPGDERHVRRIRKIEKISL